MKIKKIEVSNFMAISNEVANFNGCSAIITAGNDKGKTTLLKGIVDRFKGEKADIILKQGEAKGFSNMELTDGSLIEWKFTEKTESFSYTTPDGIKMTQGVLRAIGEKYFGVYFNIDKFLLGSPKDQSEMLGKLLGIDFRGIDSRYKLAYTERASLKKELDLIIKNSVEEPEKIEAPNLESLDLKLAEIKKKNEKTKTDWKTDNTKTENDVNTFNTQQGNLEILRTPAEQNFVYLIELNDTCWEECINFDKARKILESFESPSDKKIFTAKPEPTYLPTTKIEQEIADANFQLGKSSSYEKDLTAYNDWVKSGKEMRNKVEAAEKSVEKIKKEKEALILKAKIPSEFKFSEDGILYNDLPLTSSQISSSGKYIAALKLGSMALGKIKTMHFDASFLDKNSLSEIQKWANKNDLQLLIERPDFNGGEIKYEIIENK